MPFRNIDKDHATTRPKYIHFAFPMPWSPERWPGWVLRVLAPSRRISALLLRASRRVLGGTGVFLLQLEQALVMASLREWQRHGWWGVVCHLEALERSLATSRTAARSPGLSQHEAPPATPHNTRPEGQPVEPLAQAPSTQERREVARPEHVEPVS